MAGRDPKQYEKVGAQWWYNPINQHSLRLTYPGFKFFTNTAKLTAYPITLTDMIMPKQMLQLERLLHDAYYIRELKILYVFSEQDAVMLQLHGGDLNTYLDNLESQ